MEHRTRLVAFFAVAAAAMLVAPAAFAQGFRGGPGGGRGHGGPGLRGGGALGPRVMQALDLDESQQQQIRALRSSTRESTAPIHEDLRELQGQLRQLWSAETPDRAAILELGEQMDSLHSALQDSQTALRLQILGLLTAEQRAQLAELRSSGGPEGRQGRRGRLNQGEAGDQTGRGGRRGMGAGAGEDGGQVGRGGRRGRRGPGGPGMGGGRGLARLNLDESQQAQVQALRAEMRQSMAPIHQQMGALHEQLQAQWSADRPNAQAIQALQSQLSALRSAARVEQVDFRLSLIQLLTPEQRAQLAEGPGRGGFHGRGRGGRQRGQGAAAE